MIFSKIQAILSEQLGIDEDDITMDSNIVDDLGANSLDIAEFVMALEEDYDLRMPDEEFDNIKTIGDIVKYIEENI